MLDQICFIDEAAVAEITGIKRSTLQKKRMRGEGPPFYKLGVGSRKVPVRYRRDEVIAWMARYRVDPRPAA